MLEQNLKVMDSTAISLCMDNELPIIVFDLHADGEHPARGDGRSDRHHGWAISRPNAPLAGTGVTEERPWPRTSSRICKARIEKTLQDLQTRSGQGAHRPRQPGHARGIKVDYYGTPTPLAGVGTVSVPDARLITIKPWESAIPAIEKAINEAELGINPANDGEMVRLPIPALTEERRKEMVKVVKAKGEEHKVAVRNLRRDANERLKALEKEKVLSADDLKRENERVQKETDAGIAKVDEALVRKEKELMEI